MLLWNCGIHFTNEYIDRETSPQATFLIRTTKATQTSCNRRQTQTVSHKNREKKEIERKRKRNDNDGR